MQKGKGAMNPSEMPTIDDFRPAVLRVLSDGQPCKLQVLYERVADHVCLPENQRSEQLPSGGNRYKNRVSWAATSLYHAGLLTKPQRAVYEITEDGRTVDARNLACLSEKELEEWPKWRTYLHELAARKGARRSQSLTLPDVDTPPENPFEALVDNVQTFNTETETELRRRLQESSPEFFEKAVIELLWAMGYGGSHGEKQHVGKSHDGGIDGVIRQDALGLQNVYVQAKRYADGNSVGRQAIQQFYGALASRGAERGVFITTSTFTEHAQSEARSYRGKIVLIDGIRLTALMLAYGVGVQPFKAFTLYEVDDDFFEADIN